MMLKLDWPRREEMTMALKDSMTFGMVLPHRSPDPLDMDEVRTTAQRAEALGFTDLWVTENTLDHAFSFDPIVALTYAAAVTSTIRLGVSVMVLPLHSPIHVAHQVASLDYVSGGRAILGLGLGRADHYKDFQVPTERRVRRFTEGVQLIKALWSKEKVTYHGQIYQVENAGFNLRPVQQPHPPIWLGGQHPDALRRAATIADAWMGAGGSTVQGFSQHVPLLKAALENAGRDLATYPISKRVFMSVHERADVARAEALRWFSEVYRNPSQTDTCGIHGTPGQVRERLEELQSMGATHLLLNPVARYSEQVDALAEVVGLK
jgi:probable F420-dependent oxidoreductase